MKLAKEREREKFNRESHDSKNITKDRDELFFDKILMICMLCSTHFSLIWLVVTTILM